MRRVGLLALAALTFGSTLAGPSWGQDQPPVEIVTHELTPTLYALKGRGGTIGVSMGEDGVLLVDDQYAPLTPAILEAIGEITDQPVRFVLNTHWHGDHTGGNENLGKEGALIVAHRNVRERMSTDQFFEAFSRDVPASPEGALPVVTFEEAVTFHWNGEEIHAEHVAAAHTDGDAIVRFRNANVVHLGDVYWGAGYPLVDLSAGGSIDGMIEAVRHVLATTDDETRFIAGHGPIADRSALESYLGMLETTTVSIAVMIAEGKTLEEIQAARPTAAFDEARGEGFYSNEQYVSYVYGSLTRPSALE